VVDAPNSRIRHELELMQELQRKGIPYAISIWRMPSWLGELVSREGRQERWRITPAHWPAVLHAIGTYLLHAKEKYQVEPNYFSFNEADLGVDVLLTAEEHREAIKRIGAHFAKLGLKTKLLLGDVAGPRGSHVYAEPAANDPEARKYLGAVSFHSWGGAKPEQYGAWADLAERLKLPLIVAEAGPDAGAWQTRAYRTFGYAVREMVHYQELLLYARAQSILYWEFTGDYSLLAGARPAPDGRGLTERFCFQKHWCDLIPPGSEALATQCDTDGVLVTAFRSGKNHTIHVSNAKWERPITITGLPPGVKEFQIIRTAEGEYFRKLGPVAVPSGKVTLTLPAESLTTLTTLEVDEPAPMSSSGR
jgi:O-glycosyl hydrolase